MYKFIFLNILCYQDEFALRSHLNAAKAHAAGLYKDEIVPYRGVIEENGIKADSTLEKLSSLKPAFIKPYGTHTAANSSFLSDGGSAILIMSEDKAKELEYKPKSIIRAWAFVAVDPFEELLLGPTYAMHKVLKKMNLSMKVLFL
jgi:acetyl-CoA acyltransferase